MARKCSICGISGHNAKTCKKNKEVKLESNKPKKRKCSICSTYGHDARNCPSKNKPIEEVLGIESISSLPRAKKKEKELGYQILEEAKKKVDRVEVDGLMPQKGLWLVNFKRQKIAGKIVQVKRSGGVIWKDCLGALITTPQETLIEKEYSYLTELEPEMLSWKIIGR